MRRSTLVRLAIFLATTVAVWGILSLGNSAGTTDLEVGDLAPRTFEAERAAAVVDVEETERLRQEARDAVEDVREVNTEVQSFVQDNITALFSDLLFFDDQQSIVVAEEPPVTSDTLPIETTTTTDPSAATTEQTEPTTQPGSAVVSGVVYLDVDGDGVFQPDAEVPRPDRGLSRVTVLISTGGQVMTVETDGDGVWAVEAPPGSVTITVDPDDSDVPYGFVPSTQNLTQQISCGPDSECQALEVGFAPNLRPLEEVTTELTQGHPIPTDTAMSLAAIAADDVIRAALDETLHLPTVRQATLQRVLEEFGRLIELDQLPEAKSRQRISPPLVIYPDANQEDTMAGEAAGEVVATFLQANYLRDDTKTEAARTAAAELVEPVEVEFAEGQIIVDQGQRLTQLHIDAITQTGSLVTRAQAEGGLLAVLAVLVGVLGLYLARFRPEFWSRPRMVALLGIMIVLAAGAVRLTLLLEPAMGWYVLPAVAFGFMTAVLFDSRIAVLMALAIGILAAVGTRDPGVASYGVLATLAPIPFVSSVSSRGAFRTAVVFSSVAAAVAAAANSWFFHVSPTEATLEVVGSSAAWAFGISVVASLVGLAALQFFESAFDITTTLGLLDLTDRNHAALQLLQEEAFGSFNHSLMVGTLAHAAARAIGANALLARAMAYYHDLGKTQNPTYFIENQFGIPNPHDKLTPGESAEIIRRHVTDGVELARRFKIPTDVVTGIVSHHGDGIMRYFYEKARQLDGDDVDPSLFRHIGHKPRTPESAIVMLADSLEAACRAIFQTEEPTPEAIEKVVDRVVDEKVNDGQLQESPLTLAELTRIRAAFLDSLVGHYHQRIAYPNFPGS